MLETVANLLLIELISLTSAATLAWFSARSLCRALGPLELEKQLARHRGRLIWIMLLCGGGAAYCSSDLLEGAPDALNSLLGAGQIIAARLAATIGELPARRVYLEETWSAWQCLRFSIRMVFGWAGYWLLVLMLPFLAADSGLPPLASGIVLFIIMLLWGRHYGSILIQALDGRPLDDPQLLPLLAEVTERSGARAPLIYQTGPDGGSYSNALALPDLPPRQHRVLFTTPLLQRMTPAEVQAVFAHEVAHLEDYTPAKLRRIGRWQTAVLLTGCFVIPQLMQLQPHGPLVGIAAWVAMLYGFGRRRIKERQGEECDSDRRAVELCGNVEALISGLIKLHIANRLPTRMAAEQEQRMTHPSLARRIQLLREIAPYDPPPPGPAEMLRTPDSHRRLIFTADAVVCVESADPVPESLSPMDWLQTGTVRDRLPYSRCTGVKLRTMGSDLYLDAVGTAGKTRSWLLHPDEQVRAEAILDRVHGTLSLVPIAPRATVSTAYPVLIRGLAGVMVLVCAIAVPAGLAPMSFLGITVACLFTVITANRAWLAGLGTIVAAGGGLVLLARIGAGSPVVPDAWPLALMLLAGSGLARLARSRQPRSFATSRGRPRLTALPAVGVGLIGLLIVCTIPNAREAGAAVPAAAARTIGAWLPFIFAGAALSLDRRKPWRWSGIALAAIAIAIPMIATIAH